MKLLTYTSRIQMGYFLILFATFSVLFYFVIRWGIIQNVDETLNNRKTNLKAYLERNQESSLLVFNPLDDYTFNEVDEKTYREGEEIYSDTLIYEIVDNELDEYRKLTAFVNVNNKFYKLEIVEPHLEIPEIIITIAMTLGMLFIGLALAFYLSHRLISKKIWGPFYAMLEYLSNIRIDKQKTLELTHSKIDEFTMLNESISELVRKNKEVFESQKQFIEDASHEMQMPLSVIQSHLETLISRNKFTREQADIIEGIINSLQRLKKLNKTLLLLSKIENRQFLNTDQVDINKTISGMMEYYEEQITALNISVTFDAQNMLITNGNTLLSEILIQNLLKNAFFHNKENGTVKVFSSGTKLTIANTGNKSMTLDKSKLFNRFYKQSTNPESWGLGLAIAKKIADTSGWKLHYRQENDLHIFEVDFL
jgi:signal transduction histidine kinase